MSIWTKNKTGEYLKWLYSPQAFSSALSICPVVEHSQVKESRCMDSPLLRHSHLLFFTTMPEMKHSQAVAA